MATIADVTHARAGATGPRVPPPLSLATQLSYGIGAGANGIGALYGAMVAISLINTSSMLADVVEDSAVKTGRHDAGSSFAASSFMQQCSSALGILATGMILTWSAFPQKPTPGGVTDAMVDSLLIHYFPVIICLWTAGALILLFYPITRARHDANVEVLRAREAEARARELDNAPVGAPMRWH